MPAAPYRSPELWEITGGALRPGGLALTDRAVAFCGFAPGARVLDVGCGLGATLRHLDECHGLRPLGLDRDELLLGQARGRGWRGGLLQGDAARLPFAPAGLDGVFMECVLSIVDQPAGVLGECARVLAPGGWLALSDVYYRRPAARPDLGGLDAACCFKGARSREEVTTLVSAAGLTPLLWEDHSDLLKQLAARMAWEHGSRRWYWELMGQGGGDAACAVEAARPGYFLLAARKD